MISDALKTPHSALHLFSLGNVAEDTGEKVLNIHLLIFKCPKDLAVSDLSNNVHNSHLYVFKGPTTGFRSDNKANKIHPLVFEDPGDHGV